MRNGKRWLSMVLAVLMVVSLVTFPAAAEETSEMAPMMLQKELYAENFDDGTADGWVKVDQAGFEQANISAQVVDGAYEMSWQPYQSNPGNTNTYPANMFTYYTDAEGKVPTWSGDLSISMDATIAKEALQNSTGVAYTYVAYCFMMGEKTDTRYEIRVTPKNGEYVIQLYRRAGGSSNGYVGTAGKVAADYTWGADSICYNIKIDVISGMIYAYINGVLGFTYDTALDGTSQMTSGGIGIFDCRTSTNAINCKVAVDNIVVSQVAEPDFTDAGDWQFTQNTLNNQTTLENTMSDKGAITMNFNQDCMNAHATYVADGAMDWSDYTYGVDVTMKPYAANKYMVAVVSAYVQEAGTFNSGYQARIRPVSNGYKITVYKCYNDGSSIKKVAVVNEGTYGKVNANYGEKITFRTEVTIFEGVLYISIDGKLLVTHDTATEAAAGKGEAITSGTIGLMGMRDGTQESNYSYLFSNITVTEASAPVVEDEKPDNVEAYVNPVRGDEEMHVVYSDHFSANLDDTDWTCKNTDTGTGKWEISNNALVLKDDLSSLSTIMLMDDGTNYAFGAVTADVMITSENTGNVYAGVVASYNGERNYYHLRIADRADGKDLIQLYRMDGSAHCLDQADLGVNFINHETWYNLKMEMKDNVIYGYLDGQLLLTCDVSGHDVIFKVGLCGVRASQGSARFANFGILAPKGEVSFADDFSTVDPEWTSENTDSGTDGQWVIADGVVSQNDNGEKLTTIFLYDNEDKALEFGGVSMDVKITSENTCNIYAGPVAAYNSGGSYYHLRLGDMANGDNMVQLYVMTNKKASKLAEAKLNFTIERNVWYNLEMFVLDGKIYGCVDGELYIVYTPDNGILYTSGLVGIRASQGSCEFDNFKAYGNAAEYDNYIKYNTTVVENPEIFTDDFSDDTVGATPNYWLQDNITKTWFVYDQNGNKVYGVNNNSTISETWLHVFETNVDYTAKLYVPANGITATSKAGLMVRKNGLLYEAVVRVGYDFAAGKWYVSDDKGHDFDGQIIWAEQTTAFTADTWHTIRIRTVACDLQVWCDDALVMTIKNVGHVTAGRVGLYTENTEVYADDINLALLSGQGRVEKAALENYVVGVDQSLEGGSIFVYSDDVYILNVYGRLFISEDQGDTFRDATAEEQVKYAFFSQEARTQYIRLHNGYILKVDNYTGGKAYLSMDNGATFKQVGKMFDPADLPVSTYYAGMNDMIKEVKLADGTYRVFYCADCRGYGNATFSGSIDYHWEEVYYTDDFGYTWHKSEFDTRAVSGLPHICESRIISCTDGTLRMYCSWNDSDSMRYFISRDGGKTWEGEYAIPEMSSPKGSFQVTQDTDGTYYLVMLHTAQEGFGNIGPRSRLVLYRSVDGINWEFLMDCWRWDDVPGDRLSDINQSVDPSITVTEDHIFVTGGWGERVVSGSSHNDVRQHVLKIDKSKVVPYAEIPNKDEYTNPKDIVYIEVGNIEKYHKLGEKLNLTGATLIVHYLDGTTAEVPMSDAGVIIDEVVLDQLYTWEMPAPDMNVAGEKWLRICYKNFACNVTIEVVAELPEPEHKCELKATEATPATCDKAGNTAYWTCAGCGKYYADAEAKTEIEKDSWIIKALGHSFTKYESDGNATCTEDGTKTAKCDRCDAKDTVKEEGTAGHTLVKVDEVPATKEAAGVKAHWTCKTCKKIYADAEGKTETTLEALTIPQISDIPQAGDNSSIVMMIAVAIIAATSVVALVLAKKHFF